MNGKKIAKIVGAIILIAVPFGLTAIGAYYGYKKFKESKDKNKIEEKDNNEKRD